MQPEQEGNAGCVVNIRRKIIRVWAARIAPHAAILHGTYKKANCLAYNFLDPFRFCEIEAVRDLSGLKGRVIRFALFCQEWMRRAKDLKCSGRQLRSIKKIDRLRDSLLQVIAAVCECRHTVIWTQVTLRFRYGFIAISTPARATPARAGTPAIAMNVCLKVRD